MSSTASQTSGLREASESSASVGTVEFVVPGRPMAQPRPRVTTVGRFTRLYDPASAKSYKAMVATYAQRAMAGRLPSDLPCTVEIVSVFQMPKSRWRKKTPRPRAIHQGRADPEPVE